MKDQDQTITWSRSEELPDRLWAGNTTADEERSAADHSGGLATLGFLTAALRRKAWVWCLTGVVGLVIGTALYVIYPPAYHASTTVLLAYGSSVNPTVQVQNEASMAASQPVASRVVQELNLPQSVASLQAAYAVTVVTPNVLTINVGAPSSSAAVQRASALATTFLQYRAQRAQVQEQALSASLNQEYNAAQQRLQALKAQADQIPTPPDTAQRAEYSHLETEIGQQAQIVQSVTATRSAAQTDVDTMVAGSFVLNPATALPRSLVKGPGLYFLGGLFGGIVLGMAGVLIAALMSRRLRRREDFAVALGAPVRLSVGRLRPGRWPLTRPRRAARRKLDMKRVVTYLRGAVPGSSRGAASLAVVAVDDAQVVAQAFVSLAGSCAAEAKRVVVADLSGGAHVARLLRVSDPGIHIVSQNGTNLLLVLPQPEDVAPVGPVPGGASPAVPAQTDPALVTACSTADLLLTFATLDPAFGGDHLGTWATNVVVVATAGESSAEKVYSIGEMIRLAGTRLDSVVLIGADQADESLGATYPADQPLLINPV